MSLYVCIWRGEGFMEGGLGNRILYESSNNQRIPRRDIFMKRDDERNIN